MKAVVPACAMALLMAGLPMGAQALDAEKSITAYRVANRCFAVTDAMSRTELPSTATKRLDQLLFWGVAAKEFADAARISQDAQRHDLEAAASRADAEVASKDPDAELDLAQCEQAFRTAFGEAKPPLPRP